MGPRAMISPKWMILVYVRKWARSRSVQKFHYRFRPRTNVELVIDVPKMGADRVGADKEMLGNFFGRVAFGKLLKDFLLSLREVFNPGGVAGTLAKRLDHPTGDLTAHGSATLFHVLDRGENVGGIGALEQVTTGARLQGAENALIILIDSQNE